MAVGTVVTVHPSKLFESFLFGFSFPSEGDIRVVWDAFHLELWQDAAQRLIRKVGGWSSGSFTLLLFLGDCHNRGVQPQG